MNRYVRVALGVVLIAFSLQVLAQRGNEPYAPTKLDWLGLYLQASLRHDMSAASPYTLDMVPSGQDTITIFVRYMPTVDRQEMNLAIDTARKVANITAKGYGWDSWLKLKERIEMVKN